MRILWATCATATLLSHASLAAQAQFESRPYVKRYLPARFDRTHAVALGDVDGDQDVDILVGNDGQTSLRINQGARWLFTDGTAQLPVESNRTTDVALVDVDGDSDLDAIIVNRRARNQLWRNDGNGNFTDVTASAMPDITAACEAVAVGDIDGRNGPDLAFATSSAEQTLVFLNDGSGNFADVTLLNVPADADESFAVILGDVDGDTDLDLFVANGGSSAQHSRLYENDGNGNFIDATGNLPADPGTTHDAAFVNVDGDADLDLVLVRSTRQGARTNRVYLNDGSGVFQDASTTWLPANDPASCALVAEDVDGDTDLDLLLSREDGLTQVLSNDANSRFVASTVLVKGSSIATGDLDRDGDRDLAIGDPDSPLRVLIRTGGSYFDVSAVRLPGESRRTAAVAAADIDGDRDLDLVLGNRSEFSPDDPEPNIVLRNDGTGAFTDITATALNPVVPADTRALAFGDVDGDGDQDLVVGNHKVQSRLYLNDGTGVFSDVTSTHLPVDVDQTHTLALADFDGDNDLDLALGNDGGQQNRLYFNDGTGRFSDVTASRLPTDAVNSWAMAVGDVDGDNDLDIVWGNVVQSQLYLNDGSGTFTDATSTHLPAAALSTNGIALGDLDGDNDLDLFLANAGVLPLFDPQNRIYLNDGSGRFTDLTPGRLPIDSDDTTSVVLADLDEDGDLDAVTGVGRRFGFQNRLLLNNGTASFTDVTATRWGLEPTDTNFIATGDFDGDDDIDLALANWEARSRIATNLHRQQTAPLDPEPGFDYRIEYRSAQGYGPAVTAFPFLNFWLAANPLEFFDWGTIWVEPSFVISLPAVSMPAGTGSMTIPIPPDPTLAGVLLVTQALIFEPTAPRANFTGYAADTVR